VQATRGDSHLGGIDLDRRIYDWAIEEFSNQGVNFGDNQNIA